MGRRYTVTDHIPVRGGEGSWLLNGTYANGQDNIDQGIFGITGATIDSCYEVLAELNKEL